MYLDNLIKELKRQVDAYKYVDVGVGAEDIYCVSRERLNHALKLLRNEGYHLTIVEVDNRDVIPLRSVAKILSKNPIPQKDIDSHREKWRSERITVLNLKQANNVHRNMVRYHLIDFDPKIFKISDGTMCPPRNRKLELDLCSRLIQTMVHKGATDSELADVIKYSMVVLDAEKHHLNWQKAKADFKVNDMIVKYYPNFASKT